MDPATELFLRFDYGETRDLLKSFITLISATLALSVTFHDRVIGSDAGARARRLMFWTWAMLFAALVVAGLALAASAAAAACVIYGAEAFQPFFRCNPFLIGYGAWALILVAGSSFTAAFGTMIAAARCALIGGKDS